MKILCERLEELRASKNLSQSQISELLSMHRSTYSYYESGKTVPAFKTLLLLSKLYNLPFTDLIYTQLGEPCPYCSELEIQKRKAEHEVIRAIRYMGQSDFYEWFAHVSKNITGSLKDTLRKYSPAAQYQPAVNFGSVLQYARIKKGLLQKGIAAKLQICRSAYAYYEENRVSPTLKTIFDLSEILHYPFLSLLHERIGDEYVLYGNDQLSMDKHWAEKVLLSSLAMIPAGEPNQFYLDFAEKYIDKNQNAAISMPREKLERGPCVMEKAQKENSSIGNDPAYSESHGWMGRQQKLQAEQKKLFGLKIRELRQSSGLKSGEIAERLCISRSTLSSCEKGQAAMTLRNMLALSEIFQIPYTDFVYYFIGKPCPFTSELDTQKRFVELRVIRAVRLMEEKKFYSLQYQTLKAHSDMELMIQENPSMECKSAASFHLVLKYLRETNGFLQRDLAAFLSFSKSVYSYLEKGKIRPDLLKTYRLSLLLEYPFLFFLQEQIGDLCCRYGEDELSIQKHWIEKILLMTIWKLSNPVDLFSFYTVFQDCYIEEKKRLKYPYLYQRLSI